MKSYFASYHISPRTEAIDSTVLVFDKNLNIGFRNTDGSNAMVNWLLKDVEVSFDFSSQRTRLRHSKTPGAELWIEGKDAATFVKERLAEQQKPWYKKRSSRERIRNSFLFVFTLGALFMLYLMIVPWLSAKLASRVSIKTERKLGDAVYDAMGLPAQEDSVKSYILNNFFTVMDVNTEYNIRISVIRGNIVNAFALPGGRIIVYSALLDKMTSYPELAALLSHEFTHINNKHSTKSIFRKLGSKIFLSLLFGRFGAVSNVLVNNADDLRSLKYSRRLEKEADMNGLKLLSERNINPQGFVDLFTHIQEEGVGNSIPEFLASHPDVGKRIRYIREASGGVIVKEDTALKVIFEKLKIKQW